MGKLQALDSALACIKDGASLMIGGFLGCGSPLDICDWIAEKKIESLTVIANDAAMPEVGIGKFVVGRQIKKLIASHIGTNPLAGKQMTAGEMDVELVPQGTLAERIRSGGAGLGGFLTPTGLGTIVQENKQIIETDGQKFILELPLKADVALIKAYQADARGNLMFRLSARNFNPLMAMAAKHVVVEVEKYVGDDFLCADAIHLPGIFVDAIVLSTNGKQN